MNTFTHMFDRWNSMRKKVKPSLRLGFLMNLSVRLASKVGGKVSL